MASNLQIFSVLLIGWITIFALGWQAYEFFKGKTVSCPWDKCKFNKEGICKCKSIELKLYIPDDHHEGLVCGSFQPIEVKYIDIKA